ncbi:PTS sugar transporter, putative [Babesia ovata]|uniref:PTS sugar transporter, putative n=1 Tax=Babesia ovata TaxID=189622 RepID=A0A2H6K7B6_9APIC|nr:PTS sugar transporter, putative [Babesia ovata]GBE58897.1 PTS sugar transporter, putative [Babesia ovata]
MKSPVDGRKLRPRLAHQRCAVAQHLQPDVLAHVGNDRVGDTAEGFVVHREGGMVDVALGHLHVVAASVDVVVEAVLQRIAVHEVRVGLFSALGKDAELVHEDTLRVLGEAAAAVGTAGKLHVGLRRLQNAV